MNRTAHEPSLIKNNIYIKFIFVQTIIQKLNDFVSVESFYLPTISYWGRCSTDVDSEALKASIYLFKTTIPKTKVKRI